MQSGLARTSRGMGKQSELRGDVEELRMDGGAIQVNRRRTTRPQLEPPARTSEHIWALDWEGATNC